MTFKLPWFLPSPSFQDLVQPRPWNRPWPGPSRFSSLCFLSSSSSCSFSISPHCWCRSFLLSRSRHLRQPAANQPPGFASQLRVLIPSPAPPSALSLSLSRLLFVSLAKHPGDVQFVCNTLLDVTWDCVIRFRKGLLALHAPDSAELQRAREWTLWRERLVWTDLLCTKGGNPDLGTKPQEGPGSLCCFPLLGEVMESWREHRFCLSLLPLGTKQHGLRCLYHHHGNVSNSTASEPVPMLMAVDPSCSC